MHNRTFTFDDLFIALATSQGSLEFIHQRKVAVKSHQELLQDVKKVVRYLEQDLKVVPGDAIGVKADNSYEWVLLDLAVIYLGAILVPIDVSNPIDIDYICQRYNIRHFFSGAAHEACVPLAFDLNLAPTETLPRKVSADGILCLKFSSGSTSTPKAMAVLVGGVEFLIQKIQDMFEHRHEDRVMIFLPLALVQQRYFIYSSIYFGFHVILSTPFFSMYSLRKQKPTVVLGVPYFFENLRAEFSQSLKIDPATASDFNEFESRDGVVFEPFRKFLGGDVRYLWTGSAPMDAELLRFFSRMGVPLFQGYGSSETGIVSKCFFGSNKPGSVGRVLKEIDVTIAEDGEILVRPHHPVVTGYLSGEDNGIFRADGFIMTGDIGFMDDEGFLYITGRKKSMIALANGKKINPVYIEEIFKQRIHSIKECIVVGDKKPYLVALFIADIDFTNSNFEFDVRAVNSSLGIDERIVRYRVVASRDIQDCISTQGKLQRQRLLNKLNFLEDCYQNYQLA